MSPRSMSEVKFWKFFDSLPENHWLTSRSMSMCHVDRVLNLSSLINSTDEIPRTVVFFYIKASIHALFKAPINDEAHQELGDLVQVIAGAHQGICIVYDRDGCLLIIPQNKNDLQNNIQRFSKYLSSFITERLKRFNIAVNLSVGASIYPIHSLDTEELILFSILSAYSSEENQLNFTIFNSDFYLRAKRQNLIINDISKILLNDTSCGEIRMHYQPKYSVINGDLVGFEALSRWKHATLGYISPSEFIPLLENTQLIQSFTRCVITKVITDISLNLKEGISIPVAVNISHKDLANSELVDFISQSIAQHNVPPNMLDIEITESSIAGDTKLAIQRIQELQNAGLKVAIDDFGTGQSSFACLAQLPVNYIKLDPILINGIKSERTAVIVKTIIELAANLGIGLVAEGVETIQTLQILKSFNCPVAQGFYLGRPAPRKIALAST